MSQICLYMDEDSTGRSLMLSLRNRGVDIITTLEVNRLKYSDEEQLVWAKSQNRVLYSSNIRDFYRLHTAFLNQEQSHPGMILVQQQRYSIGEIARGILRLIAAKSAEDMENQVEFLSDWIEG
ncbi:DUF5615 family PIN-like protein [Anabaena cylindrica FACHB-243]|uniref:DUF5615 domain-containing protein n=1 Tax=Anabaena cylindrica (strain ATCC 27899 / PCC 7122) TaxID=272123 RepID=K9ZF89_ANACC|nr:MULTISPECIES: DUF5615 family PIN-like protein [Anabaena]AFZ57030.1 hypothetical protein Anacy_1523 [Anabaena cylindrica PCC 7122]MBD2421498.1 DUF5615 family PIN-like protein [Anabaena cylindrica FACHB-243]MBY5280757.1 DUF5615 family PIN-like protein [Anabaena sp. CCAP 1446/1C]MBY5309729.1 DUF5615 family PIN-like protein [Anabaena sp. CCAP 1446/1C]MCM2407741.1 DUF5615 family PIN-like protein [Anabaena sp. CCAP 1446/1C]